MARFVFTQDDILRSKIIQKPGWQRLVIVKVVDTTASTGTEGTEFTFRIKGGEYDQVPIDHSFWVNAPGFSKNFLEALGAKVAAGAQFDFDEKLVGKEVDGYCKMELTNKGNPRNVIADFRAAVKSAA